MNTESKTTSKTIFTAIFLVGFACLMLELIQVRMLSFFLGHISNFLAIPIALFGLALGSLFFHYFNKQDVEKLIARFTLAVFPVLLVSFLIFFFIANTFFSVIHVIHHLPAESAAKLLVYSMLFIPSYFVFGVLLAAYFTRFADHIGRLYFYDLAGAALGCLVTPVLFTYTDLPIVISALLVAAVGLQINHPLGRKKPFMVSAIAVVVTVTSLSFAGITFKERPNIAALAHSLMGPMPDSAVTELTSRWNELTRTSLIRRHKLKKDGLIPPTIVVQDDGISNVWFEPYKSSKTLDDQIKRHLHQQIPHRMWHPAKKILVMFAGVGKDMVLLDQFYEGKADITGVELNGEVIHSAYNDAVSEFKLPEFFARPNIHMTHMEGRDFLNNSTEKYDLIFVATNGAVEATRTGHTRKYLDTYEAMKAYMDHLNENGLMVFVNQPVLHKVYAFKKLFAERNIPDFEQAILAFGYIPSETIQSLIVRPKGLTLRDARAVSRAIAHADNKQKLYYSKFTNRGWKRFIDAVNADENEVEAKLLRDDKPFRKQVTLAGFTLAPKSVLLNNPVYASNWMKVLTVLLFSFLCTVVILVARFAGKRENRLPFTWLLYFLVSGISYMLVEIGLIARTELFMGNPLYATAVILAAFLLSNSLGAMLQDKYRLVKGPLTMILYIVVAIAWSAFFTKIYNEHLLSIPLALKIPGVLLAVLPSGIILGTFFPFGVATLVEKGKASTTPLCYALATISSVLGSTFAMTAITNVGFFAVIAAGAVGYIAVAGIYIAAKRLS